MKVDRIRIIHAVAAYGAMCLCLGLVLLVAGSIVTDLFQKRAQLDAQERLIAELSARADDDRAQRSAVENRISRLGFGAEGLDRASAQRERDRIGAVAAEACETATVGEPVRRPMTEADGLVEMSIACQGAAGDVVGFLASDDMRGLRVKSLSIRRAPGGSDRVRASLVIIRLYTGDPERISEAQQ